MSVIFVQFDSDISAYEIALQMSKFGDVYCVKDEATSAFIEF